MDEKKPTHFRSLETHPDIWFGPPYINNNKKIYVVIALLDTKKWFGRTETKRLLWINIESDAFLHWIVYMYTQICIVVYCMLESVEYKTKLGGNQC